jgi:hypothetical protein
VRLSHFDLYQAALLVWILFPLLMVLLGGLSFFRPRKGRR